MASEPRGLAEESELSPPASDPGGAPVEDGAGQDDAAESTRGMSAQKWKFVLPWVAAVVGLDVTTKMWIMNTMTLYERIPVLGDFFRLTYTHNPGAAFGLSVGDNSRIVFLILSLAALALLCRFVWQTPTSDRLRLAALAITCGGALGNAWDRIRLEAGVVDFLDFGIGDSRFPVFNVADSAVTVGATLLIISFWLEERQRAH